MTNVFTPGDKVRYVCQWSDIPSDYCKVGDIGTYVGPNEDIGGYGFVHLAKFNGSEETFLDGELEGVEEDEDV
jgi:hypothetical protein